MNQLFDGLVFESENPLAMLYRSLLLILFAVLLSGCASQRTLNEREAELSAWMESAAKPITIVPQSGDFSCAPMRRCYTLVDRNGRTYYAHNVRVRLPREVTGR